MAHTHLKYHVVSSDEDDSMCAALQTSKTIFLVNHSHQGYRSLGIQSNFSENNQALQQHTLLGCTSTEVDF